MPAFAIRHQTTYTYDAPVELGLHRLYLRPRADHKLRLNRAELVLSPPAEVIWRNDAYGNSLALARFAGQTQRLDIISELEVETFPRSEDQRRRLMTVARDQHSPAEQRALAPFTVLSEEDRFAVMPWLAETAGVDKSQYERLLECAARIRFGFDYGVRHEPGLQGPADTLHARSGSCRDFAQLLIAAARALGAPARFVTGYVYSATSQPGALAPHAWAETYVPGAGWIELDATNGLVDDGDLVPVATAISGEELTPVTGTYSGAATSQLDVSVDIRQL
jgi:transglutaminase-like putative cysteine protease